MRDDALLRDMAAYIRRLAAFRDELRTLYGDGMMLPLSDASFEVDAARDALSRAIKAAQQRYGEEALRGGDEL